MNDISEKPIDASALPYEILVNRTVKLKSDYTTHILYAFTEFI